MNARNFVGHCIDTAARLLPRARCDRPLPLPLPLPLPQSRRIFCGHRLFLETGLTYMNSVSKVPSGDFVYSDVL